ncbi:MAG: hypothetical protein RSC93_06465 [Erysipelotrichaceae bacterium]
MKISKKKVFIVILIFIAISIFICMQSQMSPFSNSIPYTDSNVFKSTGYFISKGMIPYKDFFDHKGIVLQLINYLGFLLNNDFGIWVLEVFSMFISCIYCFKIAFLYTKSNKASMLTTICVMISLIGFLEGGNLVEEYTIPFTLISLYIFNKYLLGYDVSFKGIVILGICFSIVFNLRANMVLMWEIYCGYIFIDCIIKKKYKLLLNYCLSFLIGILLVFVPIIIYLGINGALYDYIFQTIIFNFTYLKNGISSYLAMVNDFSTSVVLFLSISILIILLFKGEKEKRTMYILNLICILINYVMIILSRNSYLHYGLVLVAFFVIPMSYFFNTLLININYSSKFNIDVILSLLILISLNVQPLHLQYTLIRDNKNSGTEKYYDEISKYIQNNTSKNDTIIVMGNNAYLYYKSDRLPASKYFYQSPISNISKHISAKCISEIQSNMPSVIIFEQSIDSKDRIIKDLLSFVKQNYNRIKNVGNGNVYVINK